MRTWDLQENPRNLALKCSFVEEEREDVEKKVGEALAENFGFARKSAESAKFRFFYLFKIVLL